MVEFCYLRDDGMNQYPSCFPDDFETNILPEGVHLEEKFVYRIMKKGYVDRDGFIGTYEEIQRKLIPPGNKLKNLKNPGLYATSCNEQLSDAKYVLKILSGHHPAAVIAQGSIHPSCGPWQLTSERTGESSTHVDWWVYEHSQPQSYFEVNDDET